MRDEHSGADPRALPSQDTLSIYVESGLRSLERFRDRATHLRNRAGQLAVLGAAVVAIAVANADRLLRSAGEPYRISAGVFLLAGILCLVRVVYQASEAAMRPQAAHVTGPKEVARYGQNSFLHAEPWQAQKHLLNGLPDEIASAMNQGDRILGRLKDSIKFLKVGLVAMGLAFGLLLAEIILCG